MEPANPEISKAVGDKPKHCLRLRLQKVLSGGSLRVGSMPNSPTSPPQRFNYDRNSLENITYRRSSSSGCSGDTESSVSSPRTPSEKDGSSPSKFQSSIMTSPAIKAANQPKENSNGKSESSSNVSNSRVEAEVQQTPPLTAWWRVFKLANLLMQQGC